MPFARSRRSIARSLGAAAAVLAFGPAGATLADPLVVTPESDAEDLANAVVADDPRITIIEDSAQFVGSSQASGTFTGGEGILPFGAGVVLSTGQAQDVVGPNDSTSKTTNLSQPGDPALDAISNDPTRDAVSLQFQFTSTVDRIQFQYVFGSEEYNEFVNEGFNDVFAFFLNGQNIALVPGTSTPISIDNVNANSNSEYYTDNTDGELNTQLDGLVGERLALFATATVVPGEVNTLRLAIADAGDGSYDSAVFIRANSIIPEPVALAPLALGGWALLSGRGRRRPR